VKQGSHSLPVQSAVRPRLYESDFFHNTGSRIERTPHVKAVSAVASYTKGPELWQ
jgi:hypothetical protein